MLCVTHSNIATGRVHGRKTRSKTRRRPSPASRQMRTRCSGTVPVTSAGVVYGAYTKREMMAVTGAQLCGSEKCLIGSCHHRRLASSGNGAPVEWGGSS